MKKWMGLFSVMTVLVLAACGGDGTADNAGVVAELESAAAAITLFDAPLESNVTLPSQDGDVAITWTTSNENILSADGVIARPAYGEADTAVQVVGTFEKDGESYTEYYNATIAAEGEEAILAQLDAAVDGLSFNGATVSSRIDLPDEAGDVEFTYATLTPDVISHLGAVFKDLDAIQEGVLEVTASLQGLENVYEVPVNVAPFDTIAVVESNEVEFKGIDGEYTVSDGALTVHTMSNSMPYVDIESFVELISGAVIYDRLDFVETEDSLTITLFEESDDPLYDDVTYELMFDFANNEATVNFFSFFGAISADTETDFGRGLEFIAYEDNSDDIDPVVFDLDQYYMELYAGEEGFLAPLHLVNLFLSGSVYDVVYNGDRLYGQDTYGFSDSINRFNRSSLNDEDMPYDLQLMTYHFTAFVMDHFFGLREDLGIDDFYTVLDDFQDDWFSDRMSRHYRSVLDIVLSLDDLHTSHTMAGPYDDEPTFQLAVTDFGPRGQRFYNTLLYDMDDTTYFCGTEDGVEFFENDTVAIIHNAGFTDESTQMFSAAMAEIEGKGTVERIVINLACNSGGIIGTAWQMMGYLTDEPMDYYSLNAGDGLQAKSTFTSENTVEGDYEWFVLTSPITYSAANMFANMAKDMGLATIIGTQSSGGAASVKPIILPNGSVIRISSPNILANNLYESTELGIPVDIEIPVSILGDDTQNIDAVIDATE